MENVQILKEIAVQILGFAVVFLVLRKLAWSKLLAAIDARRQKIEGEFASIERQKKSLEELEKDYRKRLEHIEEAARAKIQEAANLGTALARDIQEKARQDAQKMIERAQSEIQHDLAQAKLSLRDDIVSLSSLITEKVLKAQLDADSQKRLVDQFVKELENVR